MTKNWIKHQLQGKYLWVAFTINIFQRPGRHLGSQQLWTFVLVVWYDESRFMKDISSRFYRSPKIWPPHDETWLLSQLLSYNVQLRNCKIVCSVQVVFFSISSSANQKYAILQNPKLSAKEWVVESDRFPQSYSHHPHCHPRYPQDDLSQYLRSTCHHHHSACFHTLSFLRRVPV